MLDICWLYYTVQFIINEIVILLKLQFVTFVSIEVTLQTSLGLKSNNFNWHSLQNCTQLLKCMNLEA